MIMEGYDVLSNHNSTQIPSSKSLAVSGDEVPHSTQELQKPWKPRTLSTATLISTAIFTGGLAVILGILQWQNNRHGALFFAPTLDGFSFSENFLYRYFPTIIIVLYGLAWSWIDLDVKRLEPWFQLAQKGGASAERSLLLQYPVDFLPLVPFKAAKLRQWTVVSASSITVLVSWGVIPLQNGLFNSRTIDVSSVTSLRTTDSFLSLDDQPAKIGVNILNTAYSIIWLGQDMPPFTTSEYTLAPFDVAQPDDAPSSNKTLTAVTLLYSTDLSCTPPSDVTIAGPYITFDDGRGCIAQDLLPVSDPEGDKRFAAYFIGYYDDANVDADLQVAGCSINSSHEFLAIWKLASTSPPDFRNASNATALFCTPSYYSQSVNATVTLPNQKVLSVLPLGSKTQLTDKEFDITHFEYLLANGVSVATPSSPRQEISETTNIHQDSRLQNLSLVIPTANMIGFAVGATELSPEAYLSPSNLHIALQRAHRLLFSVAAQAVLNPLRQDDLATGYITSQVQGVILVPVFAYLSEGILILIAIFTIYLAYVSSSRTMALFRDPDSLAQVMYLSRHADLQRLFTLSDAADGQTISNVLQSLRFVMLTSHEGTPPIIRQSSISNGERSSVMPREFSDEIAPQDSYSHERFTRPLEYSRITGFLFLVSLMGTIAVLIFLHEKIRCEDGLPLPSQNVVVQQIILNLLPTVVATMMEPVWVLLARVACMMRPLEELKAGHVSARKSLMLKYTALPPQLVPWRALRVGHVFLAALCGVTILANLLTVALSGLFMQADVFSGQVSQLRNIYQHNFPPAFGTGNGTDFILSMYSQNDPLYVAVANFSGESLLPPWTVAGYGFFPLESGDRLFNETSAYYELQARGYGADLDCRELTETPSHATYNLTFNPSATLAHLVASYKQSNGSEILCIPDSANLDSGGTLGTGGFMALDGNPAGSQAIEFANSMDQFNIYNISNFTTSVPDNAIVDDAVFCKSLVVRGWVRANTTLQESTDGPLTNESASPFKSTNASSMALSKTFISCQPRFKSALFDLSVSATGAVVTATQNSSVVFDQIPPNDFLSLTLQSTIVALNAVFNPTWHNDTFATDWFNYLAKLYTHSTALLDVSEPPPNATQASSLTSELYSRIFAIQMSLLSQQLLPAGADSKPIPARRMTPERRIFMSEPLFYMSITILIWNLIVAIVYYWRVTRAFLLRMPTNLANQIALFSGSHVIDDVQNAGGDLRELDRRGYRYGYGRYVGKDGKVHLGIEREPYVTPIVRAHGGPGLWSSLRKRR